MKRSCIAGVLAVIWAGSIFADSAVSESTARRATLGLALGGGAARGWTHLGVLKVLQEAGIPIDYVAGTSAGSLVGGLFCAGNSWREILEIGKGMRWLDIVAPSFRGLGLLSTEKLQKIISQATQGKLFSELRIPFKAVAVDITTGEMVVLDQGLVATAVQASCSIPGIFAPVRLEGRLLVDGGLVDSVPADVVSDMGADVVVGVNLNGDRLRKEEPRSMLDVLFYAFRILRNLGTERSVASVDVMITPDLEGFRYDDLKDAETMMRAGEEATRKALPRIKRLLRQKSPVHSPKH